MVGGFSVRIPHLILLIPSHCDKGLKCAKGVALRELEAHESQHGSLAAASSITCVMCFGHQELHA